MSKCSFSVCLDTVRQKYFAAVNALNAHCKHVSGPVKVHLFESYCLPILLYGLDCVNLSSQQIHELNVCWNNAHRKIFHYKPSESIKSVIYFMQRLDFHKLYDLKLINEFSHLDHEIIAGLLPWYLIVTDIYELHFMYDITMTSRSSDIKESVFNLFGVYVNNS